MFEDGVQLKILNKELDINFGAIYENVVAEELRSHGFNIYYYNSKKFGEVDFVIEQNGEAVLIEVKSGKNYQRHIALGNVIKNSKNKIKAYVFYNGNVKSKEDITYFPIYMTMFLQKKTLNEPMIYKIDLDKLK